MVNIANLKTLTNQLETIQSKIESDITRERGDKAQPAIDFVSYMIYRACEVSAHHLNGANPDKIFDALASIDKPLRTRDWYELAYLCSRLFVDERQDNWLGKNDNTRFIKAVADGEMAAATIFENARARGVRSLSRNLLRTAISALYDDVFVPIGLWKIILNTNIVDDKMYGDNIFISSFSIEHIINLLKQYKQENRDWIINNLKKYHFAADVYRRMNDIYSLSSDNTRVLDNVLSDKECRDVYEDIGYAQQFFDRLKNSVNVGDFSTAKSILFNGTAVASMLGDQKIEKQLIQLLRDNGISRDGLEHPKARQNGNRSLMQIMFQTIPQNQGYSLILKAGNDVAYMPYYPAYENRFASKAIKYHFASHRIRRVLRFIDEDLRARAIDKRSDLAKWMKTHQNQKIEVLHICETNTGKYRAQLELMSRALENEFDSLNSEACIVNSKESQWFCEESEFIHRDYITR